MGTAYKAPYSCLPLTQTEHLYQHQNGELACLIKYTRDPQLICALDNAPPIEAERIAKDWFTARAAEYREMWHLRTGDEEVLQHEVNC